jgi:flavin reductase (DIM6/NTAB) family NADH-FMN oxidoreductase RutF
MNLSSASAPYGTDEFEVAGLAKAPCVTVAPPRVEAAYAALECCATQVIDLQGLDGAATGSILVIGQVTGIHIADAVLRDGRFDVELAQPVARMGYMDYMRTGEIFSMRRPPWPIP